MMNVTNYLLVKFISSRKFVKDFLDGSLYMNSLYYFWNEYPIHEVTKKGDLSIQEHSDINLEENIMSTRYKLNSAQADMFEGTIGFSNEEFVKADIGEHLLTDVILRAVGFQYCNTLCFYRLDYNIDGPFIKYAIPNMNAIGDYVAIIKDKCEFQKRIQDAVKREGFVFLSGDVRYRGLQHERCSVDLSKKHHVVVRVEPVVDIRDYNITSKRDCFSKMDLYDWQNEWRVALYRGVKETDAYRLEIGSIRDIVECVRASELASTINLLVAKNKIKRSCEGYFGNTSRKNLKEKFYQLGENKAEMLFFMG